MRALTYRQVTDILSASGIENARGEAALLFEEYCGVSRASLIADADREFDSAALAEAVEKRRMRVPLQYILGKWDFFGLTFEVGPHCLCPRADTEITVEAVLERLPENASVLELCTGSGCIPVAICSKRSDVTAVSTDLFEETLAVAKRNAGRNGVADRITFVRSDVFVRDLDRADESFDAIVSNPPYIPSKDIDRLSPEVLQEPRAALDGGEDGLDFYREILGYYRRYLKKDGFFALEIGYDQGRELEKLAASLGMSCLILKDLEGNERCAICRLK